MSAWKRPGNDNVCPFLACCAPYPCAASPPNIHPCGRVRNSEDLAMYVVRAIGEHKRPDERRDTEKVARGPERGGSHHQKTFHDSPGRGALLLETLCRKTRPKIPSRPVLDIGAFLLPIHDVDLTPFATTPQKAFQRLVCFVVFLLHPCISNVAYMPCSTSPRACVL